MHVGILIILTFIFFSPVFKAEFINFDDFRLIIHNSSVIGSSDAIGIFKKWLYSPHYKPLVFLTWQIEYAIAGEDPFIYHFNNLIFHVINVLLVYFLLLKTLPRLGFGKTFSEVLSLLIGLLFALHPFHVESVAWATERKDVLYSLFYLTSIHLYLKYIKHQRPKAVHWLLLSTLAFLLSGFSKGMAITLPAILFLLDWVFKRPFTFHRLTEKVGHFAVLILLAYLYGLLHSFGTSTPGITAGVAIEVQHWLPGALESLPAPISRLLIISLRIFLWLLHGIFPFFSSLVYPRNAILETFGVGIYLVPFILIGLLYFAWRHRAKAPVYFFGLMWFYLSMIPSVGTDDRLTSSFLADRYLYMSVLGILVVIGWFIKKLLSKKSVRKLAFALSGILIILYGVLTFNLSKAWTNSAGVWTRAISICGSCSEAWLSRGSYYFNSQQYDQAISDYNKAFELNPNSVVVLTNRAKYYVLNGEYSLALADLNKASAIDPNNGELYSLQGSTLLQQKNMQKALELFQKAETLGYGSFGMFNNRGIIHYQRQEFRKAIADFDKAREFEPQNGKVLISLALSYLNIGDRAKALQFRDNAISTGEIISPDIMRAFD